MVRDLEERGIDVVSVGEGGGVGRRPDDQEVIHEDEFASRCVAFRNGLALQLLVISDADVHDLLIKGGDRESRVGQVSSDGVGTSVFVRRVTEKVGMGKRLDQPRRAGPAIGDPDHGVGRV